MFVWATVEAQRGGTHIRKACARVVSALWRILLLGHDYENYGIAWVCRVKRLRGREREGERGVAERSLHL